MRNYNKKGDKGAALIIVLFTLVIVSVFMSLMYTVSRKQILSETKEQQASKYSQYLRTTLDIIISPLIMGNYNNSINDSNYNDFSITEIRQYQNIIIRNPSGNVIDNEYTFDLYYRLDRNNCLWSLNKVKVQRRRINSNLTIIPTYNITINTIVTEFNDPRNNPLNNLRNNNFEDLVSRLSNDRIKYSGRALAIVVQRTPYNISTNTALFVKHSMLWVPFGADPFVALSSVNNIDKSIGITNGYNIKGDLSTPNLNQNDVNAFRNTHASALRNSGLTGVWNGTTPDRLISGGSKTGYAGITVNSNSLSDINNDFAIKTYRTKTIPNTGINNTGINKGDLPGTNNGNINLNQINNGNLVRININSDNAVLVGSKSNGEITKRPVNGGLIEMIWPTDENNNDNFRPTNDRNARTIINSYPPKYATVYLVPEGTTLRIFAVGGYSKQKVNVNTLLSNIQNLPVNGITRDVNNHEIIINLRELNDSEIRRLAAIHVNGGNVVIMPNRTPNNGLFYYQNNNTNNPQSFDLTVISTRFIPPPTNDPTTTDSFNNRRFYREERGDDLGSWSIPDNFNPNRSPTIPLGTNNNSAAYIVPDISDRNWDNRRQVVRALEGNTIIQNFSDINFDFKRSNNENIGFVGYGYEAERNKFVRSLRINNNNTRIPLKPINIISQNYVVLNYQGDSDIQDYLLSANIITTRGNLTIPDRDIYRWLMDGGRFNVNEWGDQTNGFQRYIIKDKTLTWYGKYLSNFGSVEGVANPNNDREILGFSNVNMVAADYSDLGRAMPFVKRTDWYIEFKGKKIILYDIVSFEINK